MAQLQLVEIHRSADGDWRLVRGGSKPTATAVATAATPATGCPVETAPTMHEPCYLPLAEMFANCLEQADTQTNADFAGERSGRVVPLLWSFVYGGRPPGDPSCQRAS